MLALDHLEEPALASFGARCGLARVGQLQLHLAQAQTVARTQLVTAGDALVVDEGAQLAVAVTDVVEAVILANLGVKGTDPRIGQDQVVALVLPQCETFLDQPDGGLATVLEMQLEHGCGPY